jgi:hypothetical protein
VTDAQSEAAENDEAIARLKKAFEFREERTIRVRGMRYETETDESGQSGNSGERASDRRSSSRTSRLPQRARSCSRRHASWALRGSSRSERAAAAIAADEAARWLKTENPEVVRT